MIPVTKPFSPPIEEYQKLLEGIWERNWFTNNGPLVKQLEIELNSYLGTSHFSFVNNGTVALQIAIKALGLTKKIITTPFSYVATSSSIVWEGCTPVFVDIDPFTLNIDPIKIEQAIDMDTQAILATHCFGNPCDIDAIDIIAKKYNLKVIYDAAHCFGTKYRDKSVFCYGDISTVSFHATKLFHTIEGGGIFTNDATVKNSIDLKRNFGHTGPESFLDPGINGKNSEFHAAMGLANFKYVDKILFERRQQWDNYRGAFTWNEVDFYTQRTQSHSAPNGSYFPLIFPTETKLLRVKQHLEDNGIFARRYFYPSLNKLNYTDNQKMEISESVSSRILCLPMFNGLREKDIINIIELLSL